MRYILPVDFYKKEHKTIPITIYQGDFGGVLEFRTNLNLEGFEMFSLRNSSESYLIIKTPNNKTLKIAVERNGAVFSTPITQEMSEMIGNYSYQLRVRDNNGLSTSPVFQYKIEPNVFSRKGEAVVDDAIVEEVIVGSDSLTYITRSGYEKTVWIPHETVISAEKMNKIESELEKLNIGSGNLVHIGSVAPSTMAGIWVDTKDEDVGYVDRQFLEEVSKSLREHQDSIDELYFINMSSLDAGSFEDEDEDMELDGGVF